MNRLRKYARSENDLGQRVNSAFVEEQVQHLAAFMREQGYSVGECVDASAETFMKTLLEHCSIKDAEIEHKHSLLLARNEALRQLERPRVLAAALIGAVKKAAMMRLRRAWQR